MDIFGNSIKDFWFLLSVILLIAVFLPRKFPKLGMVLFGVALVYSLVTNLSTHFDGYEVTGILRYVPPLFLFGFGWSIGEFMEQRRDSQRKKKYEELYKEEEK